MTFCTAWNTKFYTPSFVSRSKPEQKKLPRPHKEATVQRLLAVIGEEGRTLRELAAMAGMAESSTRRLLYVLRDRGAIIQIGTSVGIWRLA